MSPFVATPFRPQLPVAVDSGSVYKLTESGWGRFDKWENLQALRRETSPYLEALISAGAPRKPKSSDHDAACRDLHHA